MIMSDNDFNMGYYFSITNSVISVIGYFIVFLLFWKSTIVFHAMLCVTIIGEWGGKSLGTDKDLPDFYKIARHKSRYKCALYAELHCALHAGISFSYKVYKAHVAADSCEKSQSTLCQKSWIFSGCSGFLPQGKLTGWVRINTVKKVISQLL
jgi:hypothetical protein